MVNLELLLRIIIAALASYRIARMFALETGPFALFEWFRGRIFIWQGNRKSWINEGVTCSLCLGFWTGPILFGLTYVDYVFYGVVALAVAGLQTAIQTREVGN